MTSAQSSQPPPSLCHQPVLLLAALPCLFLAAEPAQAQHPQSPQLGTTSPLAHSPDFSELPHIDQVPDSPSSPVQQLATTPPLAHSPDFSEPPYIDQVPDSPSIPAQDIDPSKTPEDFPNNVPAPPPAPEEQLPDSPHHLANPAQAQHSQSPQLTTTSPLARSPDFSEPLHIAQVPDSPSIPAQDIDPSKTPEDFPNNVPAPPPAPEEQLPDSPRHLCPEFTPTDEVNQTSRSIKGVQFEFKGSTLFNREQLESALPPNWQILNQQDKAIPLTELLRVAECVAELYADKGYSTSGAVVHIPEQGTGEVIVQVIEGKLTDIQLKAEGSADLQEHYVRSRLGVKEEEPLNVDHLREKLQLLQLDPLISGVTAELNAGAEPGQSILNVKYEEADSFDLSFNTNNGRSPSVGSFQRGTTLTEANLLGLGDRLTLSYDNSDGSDSINASYSVPINAHDGTISASYSSGWNDVIETPFDDIDGDGDGPDINSRSQTYELSLRQPIHRRIRDRTFQEFALSLNASVRDSKSFLLDEAFPLSPGAEADGTSRVTALRFSQEWTQQDAKQVIALRSQFSLGLNALNSTINDPIAGVEPIPDSEFFSWRGQGQWVRRLGAKTLLLRGNVQLADRVLPSSEQFGIGGFGSVRGYRQDQLLTDNGIFASAELQIPIARIRKWDTTIQAVPFVDVGKGWENAGENPDPGTLASVGLGIQLRQSDRLTARIDWGIPLVSVESRKRTWQENGLYFSVVYNAF